MNKFDEWYSPEVDDDIFEMSTGMEIAEYAFRAGMLAAADIVESQAFHSDFHFRMEGSEKLMADKIRHKANGDTNG